MLSAEDENELSRAVFDVLFRLNRLQRLLDDPSIENINANGCDQVWVRYADGRRSGSCPSPPLTQNSKRCCARQRLGPGSASVASTEGLPGCRCSCPTALACSPSWRSRLDLVCRFVGTATSG